MVCEHLRPLEQYITEKGYKETYRGQPWSDNCREWVRYPIWFSDLDGLIVKLGLDKDCLEIHDLLGTHEGQEYGLYCNNCKDAIIGDHPEYIAMGLSKTPEVK